MKYSPDDLKRSINIVAETKEGRMLLHRLSVLCHHGVSIPSYNNGSFDKDVTIGKAYVATIYNELRKIIKPEHLKKIEFDYELDNSVVKNKLLTRTKKDNK